MNSRSPIGTRPSSSPPSHLRIIEPAVSIRGRICVPGDKSISHRYALLAAMAEGTSIIDGFSSSVDCTSTLDCIEALGATIQRDGACVRIASSGWTGFKQPTHDLNAGNSGTTIRMISALLSCRPMVSRIGGDESLNRRPMRRVIDPLRQMGSEIEAVAGEFPPLTIRGTQLTGIHYRLPVASAQVKSCVLLAGLTACGTTTVVEPLPSRDHTERALPYFGAKLVHREREYSVEGRQDLTAAEVEVPGDFSSAIFFILAGLLLPGSEIRIPRVGVNPTRSRLLELLRDAGADIQMGGLREAHGEPVCDLLVGYNREVFKRFPAEIGGALIPNLIDEIPALAILGTQTRAGLTIRDAGELRRKESDRIRAIASNLSSLGVRVEEREDGFHIPPGQRLRGGVVDSFGDHRIAMAFAVAGLIAEGPVEIRDADYVAISFPDYFDQLEAVRV